MQGKHCRLYDEELVRNIMVSTGLSVQEFLKQSREIDADEICEFIDINAQTIIRDTIEEMKDSGEYMDGGDGDIGTNGPS